ncbi:MAG: tetratricopeptide repeat protein [Magnetococcales bacterium]|nr:tetratricopeptide repeat protein [Magnetococcales bacterium]
MSLLLDMLRESENEREGNILPVEPELQFQQPPIPSPINGLDLVWMQEESTPEQTDEPETEILSWDMEPEEKVPTPPTRAEITPQPASTVSSLPSLFTAAAVVVAQHHRTEEEPQPPPPPPIVEEKPREAEPVAPPPPPKEELPLPASKPKRPLLPIGKQTWLLGGGAVVLSLLLAGGGYFFYETNEDLSPMASKPVKKIQPPVKTQPPTPTTIPAAPEVKEPSQEIKPPAPPVLPAPPRVEEKKPTQTPDAPPAQEKKVNPSPTKAPLVTRPANTVQLGRNAFLTGDLVTAKKHFEKALANEPHNHAAMAGLASIALREHKTEQARNLYQTIVQENPQNTLALSALISLSGNPDPVQMESQLHDLLRTAPNDAHLYFALGNVYVEQKNWPEAQNAFFNAHRLDNENPDILFNLAVSLDQLKQEEAALQFYRKALKIMEVRGGAGFNTQSVQHRIAILEARLHRP